MESCLADELVYDFVCGQVDDAERSRVDEHLHDCQDCRALVAGLSQDGESGDSLGPLQALRRGSKVGKYVLLDVLGQGAMGIVYQGYDSSLHREAAIKFLHVELAEKDSLAQGRLLREAQAMARLSHGNVVTIYEAGKVGDSVYLAMELVSGETLGKWVTRPERSLSEIRDAFGQAALGLRAAHDADLVHRDFKPDNVLVSASGRVRVTDFGLARGGRSLEMEEGIGSTEQELDAVAEVLTQTGALLGTPIYMAPEQLQGEVATPLSDQFAFCVAYYEAIYGQRPFQGQTISQLLRAAQEESPPANSSRFSVPKELHAILLRGLSPVPDDRFSSMSDLLSAMDALDASEQRPTKRGWIAAAILISAALVFVGVVVSREQPSIAQPLCLGAEERVRDSRTDALSSRMRQALSGLKGERVAVASLVDTEFSKWGQRWAEQHRQVCEATRVSGEQSESLMDLRMQCLDRQLLTYSSLSQELASLEVGAEFDTDRVIAGLPDIERCSDAQSLMGIAPPSVDQKIDVDTIESKLGQAQALAATGQYDASRRMANELYLQAAQVQYLPLSAKVALVLAGTERAMGEFNTARKRIDESIGAAIALGSERETSVAWIEAVSILGESGAYEEALRYGGYAKASLRRLSRSSHLKSRLTNNLGVIHTYLGQWQEAREELVHALRLRRHLFGEKDTRVARVLTNLGNLERDSGNYALALTHHQDALVIDSAVLGPSHPTIGRHLHNQAGVRKLMGHIQESSALYKKALAIKVEALGELHHYVALTRNSLGLLHLEAGESEQAIVYYKAALLSFGQDASHPDEALSRFGLGKAYLHIGENLLAVQNLKVALRMFELRYSDKEERIVRTLLALSLALAKTGEFKVAGALVERAQVSGALLFGKEIGETERELGLLRAPKKRVIRDEKPESGMYGPGRAWN